MSGKLLTEIDGCELALDDFKAAPNSYIDELEDKAISRLEYQGLSKPALEELELSKDVVRPLFDELADTFFELYRDAHPALADRGYRLLFDLMRAAEIIGRYTEFKRIASRRQSRRQSRRRRRR